MLQITKLNYVLGLSHIFKYCIFVILNYLSAFKLNKILFPNYKEGYILFLHFFN